MQILKNSLKIKNLHNNLKKIWIKFENSLIGFKPKFDHIKRKDNIRTNWLSR